MTKILLLSGSQRAESFNSKLLGHLGQGLSERCVIDTLEPQQVKLPIFDQDVEGSAALVAQVALLHERFRSCDGIVVASPEYNGQITPFLKNIIDWVSRLAYVDNRFHNPFLDHPVLLCSASTGWSGGAVAIPQLRSLFAYVGGLTLGDAVCLPYAQNAWTEFGYMFDPAFEAQTVATVERFMTLSDAFSKSRTLLAVAQ